MLAGTAQVGPISPVLFSLYVNDMPIPSHHVELALYADDMVVIATSRKSALLVSYLEAYLADLATSESCRYLNPSVFALLLVHLGTSVTGKFMRISVFRRSHQSPD